MNYQVSFERSCDAVAFFEQKEYYVYGWRRNGIYLYIGATTQGRLRFRSHDIVGKIEPIQTGDCIDFWDTDLANLFSYEEFLIKFFKPTYNKTCLIPPIPPQRKKVVKVESKQNVICPKCGIVFLRKTQDHLICWKCKAESLRVNVPLAVAPSVKLTRLVALPSQ